MESTARFDNVKDNSFDDLPEDEASGVLEVPGDDAGPTGPYTPPNCEDLEAVEDLSSELEPLEDSVKVRRPERRVAQTMPPTALSLGTSSSDVERLDWTSDEEVSRNRRERHEGKAREEPRPRNTPGISQGVGGPATQQSWRAADFWTPLEPSAEEAPQLVHPLAPPMPAGAVTIRSSQPTPPLGMPIAPAQVTGTAPTLPSSDLSSLQVAPPVPAVVSPFVLVADIENSKRPSVPPPPPLPAALAEESQSPSPAPREQLVPAVHDSTAELCSAPQAAPEAVLLSTFTPMEPVVSTYSDALDDDTHHTWKSPRRSLKVPDGVRGTGDNQQTPRRPRGGLALGLAAGVVVGGIAAVVLWMMFLYEKPGRLVLQAPQDAAVMLDSMPVQGQNGLYVIRDLNPGPHALVVMRPGAAPWLQAVEIPAGGSLRVEAPEAQAVLNHAPPPPTPTVVPGFTGVQPVPGVSVPVQPIGDLGAPSTQSWPSAPGLAQPRTALPAQPAPSRPPATGAAALRTGILAVNTTPWSQVQVDGRSIGNTPILNHEMRIGTHTLTLSVPAWNIRQSRRITIQNGQTTRVVVTFQGPARPIAPQHVGPGPMGPGPMGPRPMGPPPHGH